MSDCKPPDGGKNGFNWQQEMSDDLRIDSHKLMLHPERVARWLAGETIYPIYMEISPSGACNHRCTFCALDYLDYRPSFLKTDLLKERLTELGKLGLKSVMMGGEGEPLLHRDLADIILHTKSCGIDVAITTNGVLLTSDFAEKTVNSISWIKASINAGTPETYGAIHRTRPDDFHRVLQNLADAGQVSRQQGAACVIGAQMVLLPENAGEIERLAELCRAARLNYLVIKPYSQHHKSITKAYETFDYTPYLELMRRLEQFNDADFQVIFRANTMKKIHRQQRGYRRCLALPFWSYIDAEGNVWGCSAYLGNEQFLYGNIHNRTFEEIWTGERRRQSLAWVQSELDPEGCRMNCRMDEINLYLWELTHPAAHMNFI
jgi:radical SAM protein with 4Fe4S-binding SPASM domain